MKFIEGLNRFITTYISTLKGFIRPAVVFPLFLFFLIELGILWILTNFYKAPLDNIMVPLLTRFFGENITHYPTLYYMVSSVFGYASLPLTFIFGTLLMGMSVFLFASFFSDEGLSIGAAFKATISKYPILLLIWILETAIILGTITIITREFGAFFSFSLKREVMFRLVITGGLQTLLAGFFAYANASVILGRKSFGKAIFASMRMFKENFFTTVFLIYIPVLIRFPMTFINSKSAQFSGKFNPEFVIVLMIISIFIALIANLFLVGGITRIYIAESR
ncbi:MAG: hypothetical protein GY855_11370 [candidate division Zixibacteria bacterium]|nr:hypothetical protein [candidate division Zixibacteria bacterium]